MRGGVHSLSCSLHERLENLVRDRVVFIFERGEGEEGEATEASKDRVLLLAVALREAVLVLAVA